MMMYWHAMSITFTLALFSRVFYFKVNTLLSSVYRYKIAITRTNYSKCKGLLKHLLCCHQSQRQVSEKYLFVMMYLCVMYSIYGYDTISMHGYNTKTSHCVSV